MKNIICFVTLASFLLISITDVKSQQGCPNVNAGPDQNLTCNTPCANLTATVLATGATTSYSVTSIPYSPASPYNVGNPINVNTDDIWSPAITLPFCFDFFGTTYNQVTIGSNGIISFDVSNAGGTCPWCLGGINCTQYPLPSNSYPVNSIMGPYQDIDPTYQGTIYWQLLGSYPCRILVVSYYQIAYYGDLNSVSTIDNGMTYCYSSLYATSQIVLYETTNAIEIYIQNKSTCTSWNDGLAIEGIQDPTGTIAYTVPGRNNTVWNANNDAWRFTPNGAPNYTITWFQGSNSLGNNPTINVCPAATTTYTAQVVYTACSGNPVTLTDDVVVNVNNSIGLTINPANPTFCGGVPVTLTALSTNPNATYQWSTGSPNSSITVNPSSTTTYTVTATTPGCTTQASATVTVNNNPGVNVTNASMCIGGSATLTASGANSYLWSNGSTIDSITVSPAITTTYTVTGTVTGCTGAGSGIVTVNPLPNAQITSTQDETCSMANGSITALGGVSYLWSNGQTVATATGLSAGTYTVTVSSALGCTASASATLLNLPPPTATISVADATCGLPDGTATANPSGTCSNGYSYTWSTVPVQSGQTASNLPAGSYTVTVSCAGCTATASSTIINIAGPSVSLSNIINSTCGLSNGSATATAGGGTGPYSYSWNCSPVQNSQVMTGVPPGTYNVSVSDVNGCTASTSISITTTVFPVAAISTITNADCKQSNGGATLTVSSGTPPYNFNWNSVPPQTTQDLQNVPSGNYMVTVTDASGCSATAGVNVPMNSGPTATTTVVNEICNHTYGSATVFASGGIGAYTYLWSTNPPQTSNTISNLTTGTYTVTVFSGNCSAIATATVANIPGPTAGFTAQPVNLTLMDGPVTFFDNSTGNIVNWQWNFGDGSPYGSGNEVQYQYQNIGNYIVTLIVTDNNLCTDTVSDTVKVKEIYTFYIPNAFTPNGNGLNDTWAPKFLMVDLRQYDCKIFDRWGNLMFSTLNPYIGWNGTRFNEGTTDNVVEGVYVYRILLKEIGGLKHEYLGKITVLQ